MIEHHRHQTRYWAPKSVPRNIRPIFVVEVASAQPMEPWLLWSRLEEKLRRLIQEAGANAGHVFDMSPEHMPDIAAIRADYRPVEWVNALMHSDRMGAALSSIDWSRESRGRQVPQRVLSEMWEEQSFASLLELL